MIHIVYDSYCILFTHIMNYSCCILFIFYAIHIICLYHILCMYNSMHVIYYMCMCACVSVFVSVCVSVCVCPRSPSPCHPPLSCLVPSESSNPLSPSTASSYKSTVHQDRQDQLESSVGQRHRYVV
eukprot:GHVQ01007223.1.p1 GENE.GHVQ01007223.1~~GHVQ01007223.1.p1  ORF type:complete len:126 (+),score=10.47 GHVQ01007223.1:528-905(+)